jgi:hypothetical protein
MNITPHIPRIISWSVVALCALATVVVVGEVRALDHDTGRSNEVAKCKITHVNDFSCYKHHFETVTEILGPKVAMADLKSRYTTDPFVYSQCHQLGHVIGNVVAEKSADIADAFVGGDSFCWSGYYHGVVERFAQMKGRDIFAEGADNFCAKIPDKDRYGFDYYNCVHGLGHGVMAITRNQLFEALDLCQSLSGDWERRSCYGGVFMENVMVDNRGHGTPFLKPDDLLFPCNAVSEPFKEECYKMQTSYALSKNGMSFEKLFTMCEGAEPDYRRTCAQSIGRDASGQSVSNTALTIQSCSLAKTDEQATDCYIGAVKDFVSYHHSDIEARKLCTSIPSKFQMACESALLTQWAIMK